MEIHVNGFDPMTPVRNHLHISFGNGAFRQRTSFPNRHGVATRRNVGNRGTPAGCVTFEKNMRNPPLVFRNVVSLQIRFYGDVHSHIHNPKSKKWNQLKETKKKRILEMKEKKRKRCI